MARFLSRKLALVVAGLVAGSTLLAGCRCAGFYSPVYKQKDVEDLLRNNPDELKRFATGWLREHRDDDMKYEDCHGEKLTLSRYARNGSGMAALPPPALSSEELRAIQQFAKRMNLEDVSVFRASNETLSWYVQLSFQGGAKWPYGLLYIPEDEPLNMLNSASGGPGLGFSKVVPVQGRWLYFESR